MRIMLPARNRRDCDDIPAGARDKLEFVWLERVDDAIAAALEGGAVPAVPTVGVATQTEQCALAARERSDGMVLTFRHRSVVIGPSRI
jgi:hypothetical protein